MKENNAIDDMHITILLTFIFHNNTLIVRHSVRAPYSYVEVMHARSQQQQISNPYNWIDNFLNYTHTAALRGEWSAWALCTDDDDQTTEPDPAASSTLTHTHSLNIEYNPYILAFVRTILFGCAHTQPLHPTFWRSGAHTWHTRTHTTKRYAFNREQRHQLDRTATTTTKLHVTHKRSSIHQTFRRRFSLLFSPSERQRFDSLFQAQYMFPPHHHLESLVLNFNSNSDSANEWSQHSEQTDGTKRKQTNK